MIIDKENRTQKARHRWLLEQESLSIARTETNQKTKLGTHTSSYLRVLIAPTYNGQIKLNGGLHVQEKQNRHKRKTIRTKKTEAEGLHLVDHS